jgi:3',5'-cyclic-nucleotide phosphodiesterase
MVASPNDSKKPIMSLKGVIDDIENHLFNWRIWPNFGDRGAKPVLNQYRYVTLDQAKKTPIPETLLNVEAHPLAHGEHTDSTAFLIESDGEYILYMGDTGPDEVEKRTTTQELWNRIAPLIREERLHAISIEASYADERPDDLLFSHLTPAWLMTAFRKLASIVDPLNPRDSLRGLKVLITHIKPDVKSDVIPREIVQRQMHSHNDLGLDLLFIEQGKRFEF